MNAHRLLAVFICVACLTAASSAQTAEEAQSVFQSLYGDRLQAVGATGTPKDDAALAVELLEAADAAAGQTALLALLYEHAFKLAAEDLDSYDTAISALQKLVEIAPSRRAELLEQALPLHQKRYTASRGEQRAQAGEDFVTALMECADARAEKDDWTKTLTHYRRASSVAAAIRSDRTGEVKAAIEEAINLQRVSRQIDQLREQLKSNPKNATAAAELIRLLMVVKDRPREARKYSFLADPETREVIRLANRAAGDLEPAEARKLGQWYHQQSTQAEPPHKPGMLERARDYFTVFLDANGREDLAGTQAELMLKRIEKELADLESSGDPEAPQRPARRGKPVIRFVEAKSMQPFPKGTSWGSFPVQHEDDARGPFVGKPIYFQQRTGQDVFYEVQWPKQVRQIQWRGAAMVGMTISVLDRKGNVVAQAGPFGGGNAWGDFSLDMPAAIPPGQRFILRLHNEVSTWYLIAKIELR